MLEPVRRRFHKLCVERANDGGSIFEKPCGIAAELPLGAYVGTGAQDDVKAFFLRGIEEGGEIILAGKVEMAGLRLVEVPEDVGGNRVKSHGSGHLHRVSPAGTRDAGIVHFAGKDLRRFAV